MPNNRTMKRRRSSDDVDKISHLPQEILISIISRLTVAEAVCTSVLSTRWRHLSKYITRLDFSPSAKQLQKINKNEKSHLKKWENIFVSEEEFVKRCASVINHTLDTHNGGATLEEVRFYLPWFEVDTWLKERWPIESPLIERWLDFAFSKKVQIIHLHVNHIHMWVPLNPLYFSARKNLPAFKTLKELSLNGVNVDDEMLGLLLSSCVALERLSVERNYKLRVVSIVGGSLSATKLKHLSIGGSWYTKSVEIRDMMNLESLRCYRFWSKDFQFALENLPRLVEVDTDCPQVEMEILTRGDQISQQLVKLKLTNTARFS